MTETATEEKGTTSTAKKWAGKFDTPEALEEAYNTSGKIHRENQELKDKYDSLTKVPEKYTLPETVKVTIREQALLDRAARKAGLNQEHYSKIVEEFHAEENSHMQALADRRKALGEEKINVIHDYVKKFYPAKLQDVMFNEIIKDDEAMSQAMSDRDKRLNSNVPGVDRGTTGGREEKYDGQAEMLKIRDEFQKHPTQKNKERYIAIQAQLGEARYGKK